jgi:hypothetical protein
MKGFFLILGAGLVSAALGCGFGWVVGSVSPEFIAYLVQPQPVADAPGLGTALGLVSGLLLGAATMAFSLLVEAFRLWVLHGRAPKEAIPTRTPQPAGPEIQVRRSSTTPSA